MLLEDAVLQVLVEEEALLPGVVKVALTVLEEEMLDATALIDGDGGLSGHPADLLPHARVNANVVLFVEVLAKSLLPFVFVVHVWTEKIVTQLFWLLEVG